MNAMTTSTPLQPPYTSYGIFKSTAETLAESIVPTAPLDRRVLHGLSGADFGSLMPALRFLNLIDDERKATDWYRKLVQATKDPAQYKPFLRDVLNAAYDPLLHNVDIKHGTIAQLEKAFKDAGVSQGQMLTKTIRFYLKALADCGVEVSHHILNAKKSPSAGPKKTAGDKTKPKPRKNNAPSDPDDDTPSGYERLPIPGLAEAYIQYPTTLTEANCDLFDAMIGVLRTYVKGRKEKKP